MKHFFFKTTLILTSVLVLNGCSSAQSADLSEQTQRPMSQSTPASDNMAANSAVNVMPPKMDTAIFAGGCFWCVESDFEKLDGVYEVTSGYTGGGTPNPSYRNHGQHIESAKVVFDGNKISYEELLEYYWVHVDPTDAYGQFCDKGRSYETAIFARPDQIEAAENSKAALMKSKPFTEPIVTPILNTETFWDAEDYHQDYYKKNPVRYKLYRTGCGRDAKLRELWGKK